VAGGRKALVVACQLRATPRQAARMTGNAGIIEGDATLSTASFMT
jgi:hypothetical protein